MSICTFMKVIQETNEGNSGGGEIRENRGNFWKLVSTIGAYASPKKGRNQVSVSVSVRC